MFLMSLLINLTCPKLLFWYYTPPT